MVVTILSDPDGYEICFVGDIGFYDLATPLYDQVRAPLASHHTPPPTSTCRSHLSPHTTHTSTFPTFLRHALVTPSSDVVMTLWHAHDRARAGGLGAAGIARRRWRPPA